MVAFALLSVAGTLGATAFQRWVAASPRGPDGPIESTAIFVISQARDLVTLMFSALCGRYVVNLFQTAKHNSGYVLFIVVSAVVLLKLWEHTANSAGRKKPPAPTDRVALLESKVDEMSSMINEMMKMLKQLTNTPKQGRPPKGKK